MFARAIQYVFLREPFATFRYLYASHATCGVSLYSSSHSMGTAARLRKVTKVSVAGSSSLSSPYSPVLIQVQPTSKIFFSSCLNEDASINQDKSLTQKVSLVQSKFNAPDEFTKAKNITHNINIESAKNLMLHEKGKGGKNSPPVKSSRLAARKNLRLAGKESIRGHTGPPKNTISSYDQNNLNRAIELVNIDVSSYVAPRERSVPDSACASTSMPTSPSRCHPKRANLLIPRNQYTSIEPKETMEGDSPDLTKRDTEKMTVNSVRLLVDKTACEDNSCLISEHMFLEHSLKPREISSTKKPTITSELGIFQKFQNLEDVFIEGTERCSITESRENIEPELSIKAIQSKSSAKLLPANTIDTSAIFFQSAPPSPNNARSKICLKGPVQAQEAKVLLDSHVIIDKSTSENSIRSENDFMNTREQLSSKRPLPPCQITTTSTGKVNSTKFSRRASLESGQYILAYQKPYLDYFFPTKSSSKTMNSSGHSIEDSWGLPRIPLSPERSVHFAMNCSPVSSSVQTSSYCQIESNTSSPSLVGPSNMNSPLPPEPSVKLYSPFSSGLNINLKTLKCHSELDINRSKLCSNSAATDLKLVSKRSIGNNDSSVHFPFLDASNAKSISILLPTDPSTGTLPPVSSPQSNNRLFDLLGNAPAETTKDPAFYSFAAKAVRTGAQRFGIPIQQVNSPTQEQPYSQYKQQQTMMNQVFMNQQSLKFIQEQQQRMLFQNYQEKILQQRQFQQHQFQQQQQFRQQQRQLYFSESMLFCQPKHYLDPAGNSNNLFITSQL